MQQKLGLFDLAAAYHQRGALADAEKVCAQILASTPDDFQASHLLGVIRYSQGRHREALELIGAAVEKNPGAAHPWSNLGLVLHQLERYDEALASYERALLLAPDFPEALNNRGLTLHELGRYEAALDNYHRALALRPHYAEALYNRGNALQALGRHEEAIASYDRTLALRPDYPEALNNRGLVLYQLKRLEAAVASYDKAIAHRPRYAEALHNRGNALAALKRHGEAIASLDRALAVRPDHVEALTARASVLKRLNRYEECLADLEKALALDPEHRYAFGGLANAALTICDWTRTARIAGELPARVAAGSLIPSLTLLGYSSSASLQLQCAKNSITHLIPVAHQALWKAGARHHDTLRIAYVSADFHRHATAFLMAELFELHDRSRFEVLGVSFGPDDGSDMRARLVAAFDRFHDVASCSDYEAAKLLNDQVDIVVDLKGLTLDCRPGIFAHRPAPIQVSYLGYPGTMGADFIDYVIADPIVLPFDQQPFWTERIVHLPDCYQVNDSKRRIAAHTPTRRAAELPDRGFVFCCFNNTWKIAPPVFDVWMRLLQAVDGSVLWLMRSNIAAEVNLRKQAAARGVDPVRLVFAANLPLEDHLARHRLADLFLDTLPYGAHTTASDALWAGLPLVACRGEAFAGRVAASLLAAVGLPELVTSNLADYEALALRLARDPALLRGFRERLARNRLTSALFDTDGFRRQIEAAYLTMWERFEGGQPPQSFSVPRSP
jgi:protein O-GlcNAc transferase